MSNKPYNIKIKQIKDDIFEVESVKNAAQFTRLLLNVANYVEMKYNNNVGKAIRMLTKLKFKYLDIPVGKKRSIATATR